MVMNEHPTPTREGWYRARQLSSKQWTMVLVEQAGTELHARLLGGGGARLEHFEWGENIDDAECRPAVEAATAALRAEVERLTAELASGIVLDVVDLRAFKRRTQREERAATERDVAAAMLTWCEDDAGMLTEREKWACQEMARWVRASKYNKSDSRTEPAADDRNLAAQRKTAAPGGAT